MKSQMLNNFVNLLLFPEFILLIGTLVILLLGLFLKRNVFLITNNLSTILLFIVAFTTILNIDISFHNYNKYFINSYFITFFQLLVLLGSAASINISFNYYKELKLEKFEVPVLILFSSLGMMLLISSNNLMGMYLGIELQSLSLYVLAAINRDSFESSESGVKYFVLGALSSGILLYGCSLIYGFTGEINFEAIKLSLYSLQKLDLGITFGIVFILVGLAFKISAVPFHMWTPDVYQGAPTSITAFFAIVPKIAGLAIIYRFCLEPFANFYLQWSQIIIFLSIASMFLGAIAALRQNNIKRLLAYSSIGHIGYILIGLVAANSSGIKGLIIYITIYLAMNIAIFTVLLSIKYKNKYIEDISELSGLSKIMPINSFCIAIIMLSMAGIPPLAGFFGKFYIFMSAIDTEFYLLAVLGVISSVIAAYYYLRIIKIIYFDEIKEKDYKVTISLNASIILFLSMTIMIFFIFYPSLIINFGSEIGDSFFN